MFVINASRPLKLNQMLNRVKRDLIGVNRMVNTIYTSNIGIQSANQNRIGKLSQFNQATYCKQTVYASILRYSVKRLLSKYFKPFQT